MCVCSGTAFARLAALARHRVSAPCLVRHRSGARIHAVRAQPGAGRDASRGPHAAPLLADLLTHPSVIVGELDATAGASG